MWAWLIKNICCQEDPKVSYRLVRHLQASKTENSFYGDQIDGIAAFFQ